jgi:predicted nuclease of predicted toxin-antitoxin system
LLGHQANHVADVGLISAADRAIWLHAQDSGAVIVSKDDDFVTLRALSTAGPSVVWVRYGNCRRAALLERFSKALPAVLEAIDRGETVIELGD